MERMCLPNVEVMSSLTLLHAGSELTCGGGIACGIGGYRYAVQCRSVTCGIVCNEIGQAS